MAAVKRTTRKPARSSSNSNSHSTKFKNVLVVSAHPDDPDFGSGGTLAKLAKDGARVTYAIVTHGSLGGEDPKQKDSQLVAIRQKEQKAAAPVLCVEKVDRLGYKSEVAERGQDWDFEKFMRKRHREVGKKGGYWYAESFKRITVWPSARSPRPRLRTGCRRGAGRRRRSSRVCPGRRGLRR